MNKLFAVGDRVRLFYRGRAHIIASTQPRDDFWQHVECLCKREAVVRIDYRRAEHEPGQEPLCLICVAKQEGRKEG